MNEAKKDALKPEEELVDVLLDFIIVSATLAKKVTQAVREKQIKEEHTKMSKMSELDAAIRDLRIAAVAINDAADTLSEIFSGETAEAPAKPTEPVPTKEDVRAILAEMSSRGFTAQVKELLRQHGAATLSGIDPSEYAALIKDAEGLANG